MDLKSRSDRPSNQVQAILIENIFFVIALIFGALACWLFRFTNSFGSDGTSYLDMAEALAAGNWQGFINAQWSPLYPAILALFFKVFQPSPYWEYPAAHLANFLIYTAGLVSFRFFLHSLLSYGETSCEKPDAKPRPYPRMLAIVLGYILYISTAIEWVRIKDLMADMCVVVFYFTIAGIMLRIRQKKEGLVEYVGLGICLGLGYLAKAVMLPLGLVFLTVLAFYQERKKGTWIKWFLALMLAGCISAPWIHALSGQKGRLTFSDAGRLVYAASVDGVTLPNFGDGEPASMEQFTHPPRKIFSDPEIYEFAGPVGGTYPIWYDPSYWLEGVKAEFHLGRILQNGWVWGNYTVRNVFCNYLPGAVGLWFLVMILKSRESRKRFFKLWFLLIPALMIFGLYSFTHGDLRYLAAPFVVLWLASFLCLPLVESESGLSWIRSLGTVLGVLTLLNIGYSWATIDFLAFRPDLERRTFEYKSHGGLAALARLFENNFSQHPDYEIAEVIHQWGIREGDGIAVAADPYLASLWARLARVKIIAEIPARAIRRFDQTDVLTRERVFEALRKAGAKALVATGLTSLEPKDKWQQLPHSKYYVYLL